MFNFNNFEEVFYFNPNYCYDETVLQDIENNRKELEGLFIERVMKLMAIKRPTKYFPPKTNSELRNLHQTIIESNVADHHKISVLYYILIEIDYPTKAREYATALEKHTFLPQKYVVYMKGLWHLDRKEFGKALEYLTYPSLIPTFADEVMEVLVKHSKKDLSLALAYYQTVSPNLTTKPGLECLFSALARTSVTEAFFFCRAQPEHAQQHMFEMLIAVVLHNSSAETIADRSVELVNLPFNEREEAWFEEYLLKGEGNLLKKSKDTVMMRKIGTGNFKEALSLKGERQFQKRAVGGMDWATLSEAVKSGLGSRLNLL